MKLTDLQVVQITNAIRADRGGILAQDMPYKNRHRLKKIVDQFAATYKSAYELHDSILKEKYEGNIDGKQHPEKFLAFNNEWANAMSEENFDFPIQKIPVELIENLTISNFQDMALDPIIDKPDAKAEVKEEPKMVVEKTE